MDNSRISKHLGQISEYKSTYDPDLLVREPRQSNRTHIDIDDDNLPFVGWDVWNAYEASGILDNGLPFTGIMKIVYPASSKYIVESKSLKLYLNSFNSERLGVDINKAARKFARTVEQDLSRLLETDVQVCLTSDKEARYQSDLEEGGPTDKRHSACTLEDRYSVDDVSEYQENPDLLEEAENDEHEGWSDGTHFYLHSALLKSNCRVTSQPDWGDVYIHYSISDESETKICPRSLLKYIVSFRDECHFHEEICETIYKRLWDRYNLETLRVTCLYARRGGIDINPTRASSRDLINSSFINPSRIHTKTPKQ